MKKAIRVLALTMIACLALCVFAACDMSGCGKPSEEPSHTHSYSDEWSSDDTNHWHECKCGEKSGLAGHNWDDGVVTDEPTEEEEGEKLFTCSDCGKTKTEVIPVLEHTHNHSTKWSSDDDNHWHECACGDKKDLDGHNWDDGVVTDEPTEEEEGEKLFTCSDCGKTKTETIPVLEHTHKHSTKWSSDDNNHWHECACGDKKDFAGHNWDDGVVTDEPTEEEEGEKLFTCSDCGKTKTEVIPELNHVHNYSTEWSTDGTSHWHECACGDKDGIEEHTESDSITDSEPTCTVVGSKHTECTVCGRILSAVYIDYLGHDYVYDSTKDATCTEDGYVLYVCQREGCGQEKRQIIPSSGHEFGEDNVCDNCGYTVPVHEHEFTDTVVSPTCSQIGYTLHECDCGYSYKSNYIEKKSHKWNDGSVVIEKTCTEEGLKEYKCKYCDVKYREIIPASHEWSETVIMTKTCEKDGEISKTCTVCNHTEKEIIPAGHEWDEGETTVKATCTLSGLKTCTCGVCGETEEFEIKELGHKYVNGVCERCGARFIDEITDDNEHPEYGMYFEVDEILSAYGPDVINEYGVLLDYNKNAKIEKVAVYLTQDGTMWRRAIACTGENITYATYVPYLSYDEEIKYTGLNNDWINIFRLRENSDGIWCYDNYSTIGVNLEDKDGNLLLSLYDIGQAGAKTRIFDDLDEMIAWLKDDSACIEHDYSDEWTSDGANHWHKCKNCNSVIDTAKHEWNEGTVTKEPTCMETGEITYTCTVCEYEKVVKTSALGHNYIAETEKEATCTENGKVVYTCENCGDSYERLTYASHNVEITERIEATCTVDGYIVYACTVCGEEDHRETITAGHNYEVTTTEDKIIYTCTRCGDSYSEDIIKPIAGEFNVLVIQNRVPWDIDNAVALMKRLQLEDRIDGYTLTTTSNFNSVDLSLYNIIYISNDQTTSTYNELGELNDEITAFANAGGVVVYGACDGGWASGYLNYELPGGVTLNRYYSRYNYIVDASHPIVNGAYTDGNGITDALLEGTYCSHGGFNVSSIPDGTKVILEDSRSIPTLIEYQIGDGYVIASTLTWEFYYTRDFQGNTNTYSKTVYDDLIVYASSLVNTCEHSLDEGVTVEPTCSKRGYTKYTCSICGRTVIGDYTDMTAHTESEWITDSEPTCTAVGIKHIECTVCGMMLQSESIPMVTHDYDLETYLSDDTYHWHKCKNCTATTDNGTHTYESGVCVCGKEEHVHTLNGVPMDLDYVYAYEDAIELGITMTGNVPNCTETCRGMFMCDECMDMCLVDVYGEHNYDILNYDSANHWYECECGLIDGETAHYGGTATCTAKAKCTVCSQEYGELTTHDYATTYTSDDTSHWRKCNDCSATTDNGTHTYENGVCVCGKTEEVEAAYTVVDDDTILFGSYPQSEVTDTTLISTLSASAGTLPTSSNSASWTSYGYYIEGSVQNYMWYIDLDYSGERYRGVYFTSYRPYYTTITSSEDYTEQDDNGYSTGTVYWFKYEPISWTILDKDKGLILCDMIIDSQAYQNEHEYDSSDGEYYIKGTSIYANNYEYSTIRAWLNDTFYNTAFNALQKGIIKTAQVDNSVASTGFSTNPYVCNDTNDKVFLLSEATSYDLGFESRQRKNTAYAQSQGAYTSTSSSYLGNGYWWLRSPHYDGSYSARYVFLAGSVIYSNFVVETHIGVVPALQIQLNEEEHTHSYDTLNYDSANHWYECKCGEIDGETAHYGGTATCTAKAKCTVCSQEYGELKTHDYATTYTSDDTNHWRKCNDCTATTDNGTHTYTNGVCVCGKTEEIEAAYTVVDEDTILFGSYPQSEVTDTTLISTLSANAGTLPTSSNSASWTSYGYYINDSVQNYMWYIDLGYSGERYRGVYFTSYRPYYTNASGTYQDDNGYSTGTVYWFKYEPISWTILDEDKGLILCDMIIDSQAYQNEYEYNSSDSEYYIKGTSIYANNYKYSTIRAWLNDTFYNTAFNTLEKGIIKTTQVDNSVASTGYTSNPYVCNDTNDKVFLLSYSEVTSYGLSSTTRRKKTTAYAQSQGAYTSTSSSYLGNGCWWLRSPDDNDCSYARYVDRGGYYVYCTDCVYGTGEGVVPALQIQL